MIKDAEFCTGIKNLTAPSTVDQVEDLAFHLAHVPSVSLQTELEEKTTCVALSEIFGRCQVLHTKLRGNQSARKWSPLAAPKRTLAGASCGKDRPEPL